MIISTLSIIITSSQPPFAYINEMFKKLYINNSIDRCVSAHFSKLKST